MRIAVVDTETTGLDPREHGVCEYAHVVVDETTGRAASHLQFLCDPGRPIPPEARAVHHLADEEVQGLPGIAQRLGSLDWSRVDMFAAHNAKFDHGFLSPHLPTTIPPWIDTWRCAMHAWPDAPAHGNQVLRYYLDLKPLWPSAHWPDGAPPPTREWAPHRALYDACVTAALLLHLLQWAETRRDSEAEFSAAIFLQHLSTKPVILQTCRFGQHRGKPWSQVPLDYLRWIMRQSEMDADVTHTALHYLEHRA